MCFAVGNVQNLVVTPAFLPIGRQPFARFQAVSPAAAHNERGRIILEIQAGVIQIAGVNVHKKSLLVFVNFARTNFAFGGFCPKSIDFVYVWSQPVYVFVPYGNCIIFSNGTQVVLFKSQEDRHGYPTVLRKPTHFACKHHAKPCLFYPRMPAAMTPLWNTGKPPQRFQAAERNLAVPLYHSIYDLQDPFYAPAVTWRIMIPFRYPAYGRTTDTTTTSTPTSAIPSPRTLRMCPRKPLRCLLFMI